MSDRFDWTVRQFDELSLNELYAALKLRQDVFVVEQECCYVDTDDADQQAIHMLVHDESRRLVAYQRFFAPGVQCEEAVIGRIIVSKDARGTGLGYELVQRGIDYCTETWGGNIRIAAQAHLQGFYGRNGFVTVSEPSMVDGIPHVDMLWEHSGPAS